MRIQGLSLYTTPVRLLNASVGWLTGVVHAYDTGRVEGILVRSIIDRQERFVGREQFLQIDATAIVLTDWQEREIPDHAGVLHNLPVFAVEQHIRIGKITETEWEGDTGDLLLIHVRAPWWKWNHKGYTIPRSAIVEITAQGVFVEHYTWYKIGQVSTDIAPILS